MECKKGQEKCLTAYIKYFFWYYVFLTEFCAYFLQITILCCKYWVSLYWLSVVLPSIILNWLSVLLPSNSYFTINGIFPSRKHLANNFFTSFAGHHNLIFHSQQKPGTLTRKEAKDLTLFIFEIQIVTVNMRDNCACFTLNSFCNIIVLSITRQDAELLHYDE